MSKPTNTARSVSHVRISRKATSQDLLAKLTDKLTADEREWVERHPRCWSQPDTTPAPEPETGQPHDHFSFGHESELYGMLNEPDEDDDGNTTGWLADEFTPAEIEGYRPTKPVSQRERLSSVENATRDGEANKANAEGEALKPELRHAVHEKSPTNPVLNDVLGHLSDEDLKHPLERTPRQPRKEPMEWTTFTCGRAAADRLHPRTARTRCEWERAEAQRQAEEYAEAMRRPPLVDGKHAAKLLGITTSSVRQWAKRHHIIITKIGSANYYRLSDVLYYAATLTTLMEPAPPTENTAAA